jgi:hypothetical protein
VSSTPRGVVQRVPVTIVCVYNDPAVLERCLARSVTAGLTSAPETEFLPVDNRGNRFTTAGAALNDGARRARHDVVVFVHQDVVLHSLDDLEAAAGVLMANPDVGILGAIGMDSRDRLVGRIRDRVVEIGESAPSPRDIDSVDEVLFMIRREQVLAEPISEDPLLAWHAYGVEYCARMRRRGMRAAVIDLPLTHNSLTTNLKDLDLAHRKVGDLYPEQLPLRTTCGTIWRDAGPRGLRRVSHYAARARIWWQESAGAHRLSRLAPSSEVVIADVRMLIDDMMERGGMTSLRVLDLEQDGASSAPSYPVADLVRFARPFSVATATAQDAWDSIRARRADQMLLITAPDRSRLAALGSLDGIPHVMGLTHDTGVWVAIGVPPAALRPLWSTARNRPFAGLLARQRPATGLTEA